MLDINNNLSGMSPRKKPTKGQDNAPLFVSLYIVLLAFFIMLNSISQVSEEKVESAVNSISDAFDMQRSIISIPRTPTDFGNEIAVINVFGKMEKLTKSFIPIKDIDVNISGNVMETSMPTLNFFTDGQHKLRSKMQPFIKEMSQMILSSKYADGLELEIIIPLPVHDLVNASVAERQLSYHRAAELIKYFINSGLPKDKISTAVRSTPSNNFVIRFIQKMDEGSRLIISKQKGNNNAK